MAEQSAAKVKIGANGISGYKLRYGAVKSSKPPIINVFIIVPTTA